MKTITDEILLKTKAIVPRAEPCKPTYSQFNSGSIEIEVAEFLYSMVRLQKPEFVLETGTHKGISALYMGLACDANEKGTVETYEVIRNLQVDAKNLWKDVEISHRIDSKLMSSLSAQGEQPIDILFLDSEPHLRFDEFVKFWPRVSPGGWIMIHDLHPHLGHTDKTINGMYDWPYGDYRPKLGHFIKKHQVQTFSFPTGRGFTVFQKASPEFAWSNSLQK